MHLVLVLVLVLVAEACVASTLVGVATQSLDGGSQVLVFVDPLTGHHNRTLPLDKAIGGIPPACFAVVPQLDAAALCSLQDDASECVNFVSLGSAATLKKFCSKTLVIDNLVFDTATSSLYFSGFDTNKQKNFVYELDWKAAAPTATVVVEVPGKVQVAICSYRCVSHASVSRPPAERVVPRAAQASRSSILLWRRRRIQVRESVSE
jgi:hypothetical protein